ncbi:MAG: hypothetical protein AABW50_03665 [Nanoarchaeota archaeon]
MANKKTFFGLIVFMLALVTITFAVANNNNEIDKDYTSNFLLDDCNFKTVGENPYFILKPKHKLVLEGQDGDEEIHLEVTVLGDKERIFVPGIGRIETRVVEEREWINGELIEVSRNFFAICKRTNDVYYFGEDVDIYENGEIVNHSGAWRAGENNAMPGIMMPGTFLLGSRYFQEIAPGVAMDQGENVEMELTIETKAGTFENCVKVIETTPLEPGSESEKVYCLGIGLTIDNSAELVEINHN